MHTLVLGARSHPQARLGLELLPVRVQVRQPLLVQSPPCGEPGSEDPAGGGQEGRCGART